MHEARSENCEVRWRQAGVSPVWMGSRGQKVKNLSSVVVSLVHSLFTFPFLSDFGGVSGLPDFPGSECFTDFDYRTFSRSCIVDTGTTKRFPLFLDKGSLLPILDTDL